MSLKRCCCAFAAKKVGLRETDGRPWRFEGRQGRPGPFALLLALLRTGHAWKHFECFMMWLLVADYDERGNQIEEAYFDATGNAIADQSGVARWTAKYSEGSNLPDKTYFDRDAGQWP
jgi:hypothetical protein